MAFRQKNDAILKYKPDILIVPECENENKLKFGKLTPTPNDFFWYGNNENKGIGVFSYSDDYKFKINEEFNSNFRYIIPLSVYGKKTFNLFAIWTMNTPQNLRNRYIAQLWKAVNHYDLLLKEDSILIGDLNSNKIWDNEKPQRIGTHSVVVDLLKAKNIYSIYHKYFNEEHGEETRPTYFFHNKESKSFHIDYCFASLKLLSNISYSMGTYNEWIKLSDHVPIIVDVDDGVF